MILIALDVIAARWSHDIGPNFIGSRSVSRRYKTLPKLDLTNRGRPSLSFAFSMPLKSGT